MVNENWLSSGDDFSDADTSFREFRLNSSNGFLPASPPDSPVVQSPEKLDSMHVDSDAGQESMLKSRKKRKGTLSSYAQNPKRIWSQDDELVVLKGIVDYRNKNGVDYCSDASAFFDYIKDAIDAKVSREQLVRKIRKLKAKFKNNLRKNRVFTDSHDSDIFDSSMAIWGTDTAEYVGSIINKAKGTKRKVQAFVEHEEVAKDEPENDDESAKGDSFDKLPSENFNKNMANETGEKRKEEDEAETNGELINNHGLAKGVSCGKLPSENVDERMEKESEEDELCTLQDALETALFQDLSNYSKTLMLQKLRTLEAKKRKEMSDEWKSLIALERQLTTKKLYFSAKLANAALHHD